MSLVVALAAVLLAAQEPAAAPPPQAPPAAQAEAPPAALPAGVDPSDPVVCRKRKVTGSRLKTERTCLTKKQWEKMAADARTSIGKVRDKGNGPGGGS